MAATTVLFGCLNASAHAFQFHLYNKHMHSLDRCFWHTWNEDRFGSDKNGLNRLLIIISSFCILKCIRCWDGTIDNLPCVWIQKWKTMAIDFRRSLRIDFLSIGSLTWNFTFSKLQWWFIRVCVRVCARELIHSQTLNQTESKRKRWKIKRKGKHQQRNRNGRVEIMDYFWMLDIYFSFLFFIEMNGIRRENGKAYEH